RAARCPTATRRRHRCPCRRPPCARPPGTCPATPPRQPPARVRAAPAGRRARARAGRTAGAARRGGRPRPGPAAPGHRPCRPRPRSRVARRFRTFASATAARVTATTVAQAAPAGEASKPGGCSVRNESVIARATSTATPVPAAAVLVCTLAASRQTALTRRNGGTAAYHAPAAPAREPTASQVRPRRRLRPARRRVALRGQQDPGAEPEPRRRQHHDHQGELRVAPAGRPEPPGEPPRGRGGGR